MKAIDLNYCEGKKKRGLCIQKGCSNPGNSKKAHLCHKHYHNRRKQLDPAGHCFEILKSNAKRRGHEFGITIEQWREWCDKTGYIKKKGRLASCITVDRIDPTRGYFIDNIQPMRNSDNVRKAFVDFYQMNEEHNRPLPNWFGRKQPKVQPLDTPF